MKVLSHGVGHFETEGRRIGPAEWAWPDIIVAWEETTVLHSREETFTIHEGDALLVPPGNPFEGRPLKKHSAIWVTHFQGYQPMREDSPFALARTPTIIPKACRSHRDRVLFEELTLGWRRSPEPTKDRSLRLLTELILTRIESQPPPDRERERFRAVIDAALARNPPVTRVSTLARKAGVSPSYFRQSFKEDYGMSPHAFLQHLRMEEARRLLQETAWPIKEIGHRICYRDVATFHRAFVREVHTTPAEYRRRHGVVM